MQSTPPVAVCDYYKKVFLKKLSKGQIEIRDFYDKKRHSSHCHMSCVKYINYFLRCKKPGMLISLSLALASFGLARPGISALTGDSVGAAPYV